MNGAEAICSCIEGANLIGPAGETGGAAGDAAGGPLRVQEAGAEDTADGRKQAIPRRERPKGRDLEQGGDDGALYVRRLVREGPEPRCPGKRGCSAAIAAFHWGIACSRRQLGPALPNSNDNNAYYINTDGTVNNNNVYNANFAPRPALMELPCTSSPCGESRGPSSKEAISRRPWA